MKLLLTAFDPFGGSDVNPALEAVRLVAERIGGVEIVKLEVPTVFGKSVDTVVAEMARVRPDAVLCIGQAGGRYDLTPERVAINLDDARIPDNEGRQPVDMPIFEDGAPAYFSSLPIKAMVAEIREAGLPASVSNTAGTFVCNHLTPTCTEQGYTTFTCECGDSYVDDYVPEKGHDEGIWSVTKPSTPTESGVMHLFCGECGFVLETKVIPATGKVRGVAISDVSLDYKASTTITPSITVDSGVKYTVTYSSSNPSVASVDANGKVVAGKTGSATITVTVTDEFGNTVSDTCTVKVNYNWWQWIIVIVLFGWIWY